MAVDRALRHRLEEARLARVLGYRLTHDAKLGPCPCTTCKVPLYYLGDGSWHDTDGLHHCEVLAKAA